MSDEAAYGRPNNAGEPPEQTGQLNEDGAAGDGRREGGSGGGSGSGSGSVKAGAAKDADGTAGTYPPRQQASSYQDTSPVAAGLHTRAQQSHRRTHSSNLPHSSASPSPGAAAGSGAAATPPPRPANSHESDFARGQALAPSTATAGSGRSGVPGSSETRPPPSSPPISPTSHVGTATPLAHFVAPSHYLRPPLRPPVRAVSREDSYNSTDSQHMTATDREQIEGLRAIRAFLKKRTAYDVLPLSYRLIVFDTSLLVKKSLSALTQCAIVSAPLWDAKTSTFAGMLTASDYLNVVQYYWQFPDLLPQIDQFRLDKLRDIERAIGVSPIETVSTHPLTSLYEACRRMLASRARRIPLVDVDDETKREMVISVITQYRILKFMTINVPQTQMLKKPLRELNIGTYENLVTCSMDTPVIDVIHQLVQRSISCVPILDHEGTVLNVFEAVDVIALIKGGDYDSLTISVGMALNQRPEDFPGIYTCTPNDRLHTIFETIRKSRVHRLVIIDDAKKLQGVLSLSDLLDYTLNSPLGDEDER